MKTKEQKPITKAQITKIHTLLNKQGLMDEKRDIISSVSSGRIQSTKELTCNEACYLISYLLGDVDKHDFEWKNSISCNICFSL